MAQNGPENVIPNPSFEETDGGKIVGWQPRSWQKGQVKFDHASFGHTGTRCVAVSSETGADAGWTASFEVKAYSTYRFTGWIKTENVAATTGKGALFNVEAGAPGPSRAVTGTNDWTQVDVPIDTDGADCLTVNCVLGGWGLATGTAWFDDLRPRVGLDAGTETRGADRCDQDDDPRLEVYLRAIYRASGTVYLRRHLGRDA